MTDEELLDWYKNGASKGEMSDQDYELNKNKALSTQGNKLLDSNLANSQTGLAKQQTSAQQSASIGNDKLMKYLGQKQLSSGLATGQTGSDFINANNAYTQNRAAINNNFSAQNAELLSRYASDKLTLDENSLGRETSIDDKYRQLAREDEQTAYERNWNEDERDYQREYDDYMKAWNEEGRTYERAWNEDERQYNRDVYADETAYKREQDEYIKSKANEDEVFDYLMNDLLTGNFNNTAEMEARLDEFKDVLAPERYKLMKSQITSLYNNRAQRDADADYDAWSGSNDGSGGQSSKYISNYAANSDELKKYVQDQMANFQTKNNRSSADEYFNDAVNGKGNDTQEQNAAVRGALLQMQSNPNWKPQKYDDLKDFSMEELWKYVDNKGDPQGYKKAYGADKGKVYYAEMFAYLALKQNGYVN